MVSPGRRRPRGVRRSSSRWRSTPSSTPRSRSASSGSRFSRTSLPERISCGFPLPWEAAFLAGKCFVRYRRRGGGRSSPLPDFYIGAHAAVAGPRPPHARCDALSHVLPGPRDHRSVAAASRGRATWSRHDQHRPSPVRARAHPRRAVPRAGAARSAALGVAGVPDPRSVMALYWAKYLFVFVGGWAFFVSFNAGYPGFISPLEWAFTRHRVPEGDGVVDLLRARRLRLRLGPDERALQAAVRRLPPLPAARARRSCRCSRACRSSAASGARWLDVALYAANQLFLLRALVAPEITPELLLPSVRADPADRRHRQDALPRRARRALLGGARLPRGRARGRALDLGLQGWSGASSGSGPRRRSSTTTFRP